MKSRIKLAMTILVLVLAVGCLSRFLDWMNLPSDLWFWSGLAGLLLLLVVNPSICSDLAAAVAQSWPALISRT
jgi:uncharacterized membrane protein YqhA